MEQKVFITFLIFALTVATLGDSVRMLSRQRDRERSKTKTAKTRILKPRSEVFEDLFNVYDPSFLAVVWPKINNGVHLFVDPTCWKDISEFFKDLSDGRAWAYNAVDASGRYQSGLFEGNTFWLGSKQECLQLDNRFLTRGGNDTLDEFRSGEYLNAVLRREKYFDGGSENWRSLVQRDELMRRLVLADHSPPYRMAYTAVQLELNLTKITMAQAFSITLGICLPRTCSTDDIASIISFSIMINDNLKSNKTIPRTVKLSSLRHVEDKYDISKDLGALLLICVTIILFSVALTATTVEKKWIKCKARNSKSMSFDLEKFSSKHIEIESRIQKEPRSPRNHHSSLRLPRKDLNLIDQESLTISNINNSNNINLVTVKKVMKPNVMPPSITLDVVSMERVTGSCNRCGKFKKQCNVNHLKPPDNLSACPRVKSFASLTTEPKKKENLFKSLLLCFSLSYSWRRIFNTNMANKDLSIIHILKILATFWVIFMHVAMIANYVSDNSGDVNDHNNIYYILTTGTLGFDTLFFVSGVFSGHHFFFLKSQYSVEELVSFGGVCGQALQFLCFVTNRAVRLLPSYAYAIFLTGVAGKVTHHTSALTLPESGHSACDSFWWRNMLYITTLFSREDQCMQISWFMSVETQLHLFGALACAISSSGRRLVVAAAMAAILIATAADVSASFALFQHHFPNSYAMYGVFMERPLARVAPYLIGLFAGWLVIKLEGRLHISKTRATFLWLLSTLVVSACVSTPWVLRPWVTSWLHPLWPIALLWPAINSATTLKKYTRGILESRCVAALSRLCYGMLLLHGLTARLLMLSADTALCSHTICIWWYFAGTTVLCLVGALWLSLLVETPCCSLLRRLSDYAS